MTRAEAGFTGLRDGYYPFGRGAAVVRTELFLERPLQLAVLGELLDDVGAADQLAADEDLRDRRPAREGRQLLPDARVGKDVDGGHGCAGLTKRTQRPVGVPAHHVLRRALHEERHRLVLDDLLDGV